MKELEKELADIFDVIPLEEDVTDIVTVEPKKEDNENPIVNDTEIARGNIKILLEKGNKAVEELMIVARDSQHPRAYEVLATMMKNLSDMNKDLLEIQKRKKDLLITPGETKSIGDVNVDKAVFVGSTVELMKLLKK